MQFKVGDQVMIKGDLEPGQKYGNLEANNGMCALKGNVSTVSSLLYDSYCRLDGYDYLWTEDMLDLVVSEQDELIKELNMAKSDNELLHKINLEMNESVMQMQDEFAQICKTVFECGNKIKALNAAVQPAPAEEPAPEDDKSKEKLAALLQALLEYMNSTNNEQ